MISNLFLTFFSGLGGFLFGYDTGVISGALPYLRKFDILDDADPVRLASLQGLIVSSAVWAAALGSAVGGLMNDAFGRKVSLVLADTLFIFGSVTLGLAPSFAYLIIGRIAVGLGVGIAAITVPVYIAECSPSSVRATMVSASVLMITVGQFVAYLVNYGFARVPGTWRWMLGVAAVPAIVQLVGLMILPESPRWLLSKGRTQDCQDAVKRIFPESQVTSTLDSITEEVSRQRMETRKMALSDTLKSCLELPQTRIGVFLQILQQMCGINTVMYFTPVILEIAGFRDKQQILLLSCLPASVNAIGTVFGMKLVDRAGRRILLLASLLGVVASMGLMATSFYVSEVQGPSVVPSIPGFQGLGCSSTSASCTSCLQNNCLFCAEEAAHVSEGVCIDASALKQCTPAEGLELYDTGCPTEYSALLIACLMIYLATFSIGLGHVPWVVNSEIYPTHLRGVASGLAGSANWITNAFVSQTFLLLVHALRPSGTFFLYGSIAAVGAILVYFHLPETKGLTLGEVQALFVKPRVERVRTGSENDDVEDHTTLLQSGVRS